MTDPQPILAATGLHFAYRTPRKAQPSEALAGVDVSAPAGQLLCVLGPNGSGKTTLLRCLLGRLKPSSGKVLLDGRPLLDYSPRRRARRVAYVPQTPVSAFAFTCWELVLTGRFAHLGGVGLGGASDHAVARQAMIMTQTIDFADRTLDELSGGEAQRVMIARALSQQPSVMLLDEPTSHLDIKHQLGIYQMMGRLAHDWGMAVVCVSHDINLAARFADRLMLMRDGSVLAAGKMDDVVRPDVLSRAYDVAIEIVASPDAVPLIRARP